MPDFFFDIYGKKFINELNPIRQGATHVVILDFAWILSSDVRFTQRICTRVSDTRFENHAFASRTNPRHVDTLGVV